MAEGGGEGKVGSGAPPVFISYASQDAAAAAALVEALEQHGISCWIAPRNVKAGALYAEAIVRAISDAKALVLVLSGRAIASSHVSKEIERASSKKRPIIALRIDLAPLTPALEYFLSESQWVDAHAGNIDAAYAKLVDAIREPERAAPGILLPVATGPSASPASVIHPKSRRYWILFAAGLAVVATLVTLLADKLWLSKHAPAENQTTIAANVVSDKSIAVLPFADMSEKHDQEYFADGMADEILDLLAKVPQLTVIGRTSSFQFKGRTEDLRAIGEKLGATYVVEGSVRKAAGRIRVTAQLVDSKSGTNLWSESFDREFGDVLTLQDEISGAIARALQVTIAARDPRPLRHAHSAEAYTLYLKGKVALDRFNKSSLADAQGDFQHALELDPTLVPAAEGIARTLMLRSIDANDLPAIEGWVMAKTAAESVQHIDANSAVAHVVLAFVAALRDFDWATADEEIHKALALNPNDAETLVEAAQIASARGNRKESLRQLNASLVIDPLNAGTLRFLGIAHYLDHDYARAESALRKSLAIDIKGDYNHYLLGLIKMLDGHPQLAINEFLMDEERTNRDGGLAIAYHALGKKAESDAALKDFIPPASELWPYGIALVYAYRGDHDKAFEWLDRAYAIRDSDLPSFVLGDPFLIPLHDDPRWGILLLKLNLSK
jgi:TolB-like protein